MMKVMIKPLNTFFYLSILSLASVLAVGCQNDVYYHQSPNRHVIVLDGQRMSVLKLNDGTWEVAGGNVSLSEEAQALIDRQLQAISLVSGCTVVKSTIFEAANGNPPRLIAQVQCKDD